MGRHEQSADALLSLKTACERLGGISVVTVRRMIARGDLRAIRIGRRVMVEAAEVSRVIEEARQASRP